MIDTREIDHFARRLAMSLGINVEPGFKKVIADAAPVVAQTQYDLAPVWTGGTERTISAVIDKDGMGFESGTESWYAHFVEGGTQTSPPKPYIQPGLDLNKAQIIRNLDAVVADALDELGR